MLNNYEGHSIKLNYFLLITGILSLFFTGCVTKKVIPLEKKYNIQKVCIEENLKVIVKELLPIISETFNEHGIKTQLYKGKGQDDGCQYIVKYTALQSWDYIPYVSVAQIVLLDQHLNKIGYAKYDLFLKGGYDFRKYKSVRSKIKPLIEELLINYK